MKRLILLASICVFAFGCSDDVETNTPVIQGSVNEVFFRAKNATATLNEDGSLKLIGKSSEQIITLQTASFETGQYTLGAAPANEATFTDFAGSIYIAGSGAGDGMIEITKYEAGTVSGAFHFNALNNGVGDTLNFQKGVFFEVPITNLNPNEGGETDKDFITADIGETPFDAEVVVSQNNLDNIQITGSTQTVSISLTFPSDVTAGSYPLASSGQYVASYLVGSISDEVDTGELIITKNDTTAKIVEGEFSFTTVSGIEISNGKFSISY